MFLNLTPDLADPQSLTDVNLKSLAEAVGLTEGEVTLTVDPTLTKPVRIRPDGVASYSLTARRTVEDLVLALNDVCTPFSIEFLKAKVRADGSIWPLDLQAFVSTLQRIYLAAQKHDCVAGNFFMLELNASPGSDPMQELQPGVILCLTGHDGRGPARQKAMSEYSATANALWAGLVRGYLGQWLRDNGIREFRLGAEIYVEPREAKTDSHRKLAVQLPTS